MSVYIIAIGGTGARFAEAVVHLGAAGLYAKGNQVENLEILFVDPDKGNGNVKKADQTLKIYQKCAQVIDQGIDRNLNWWWQTEVKQFEEGLWSPFQEDKFSLRDVFKYDDYNDEKKKIRHLFDVLYTEDERDLDLKEGFRGRPAIGSAIMTRLSREKTGLESWRRLISKIAADCQQENNPPKVFMCGSIFGGTGASGFPTLGRLIANALTNEKNGDLLKRVKLGGLLMLPYFSFPSQGQDEKAVYARSEDFILKTETALRYYGSQDWSDAVYLLGMPSWTKIEDFSTGGASQRNQPHILELYGAMALRDFIFTDKPKEKEVGLVSHHSPDAITWDDLPDKVEARQKLVNSARFAYAWLAAVVPELEHARTKPREIFYVPRFYRNQMLNQTHELDKIQAIKNWSEAYLTWLGTLHSSVNNLNWFNSNAFFKRGELQIGRENFRDIFGHAHGIELARVLRQLNKKGIQGENEGTVGLAKALYRVIDNIMG